MEGKYVESDGFETQVPETGVIVSEDMEPDYREPSLEGYADYRFEVSQKPDDLEVTHHTNAEGEVFEISLHVVSRESQIFPRMVCKVTVPSCGVYEIWNPKIHLIKALNLDWFQNLTITNGFTGAPVSCLIDMEDKNCGTLAISDTLSTFDFRTVPVEESSEYSFTIELFTDERVKRTAYDVTLRLDLRRIRYEQVLKDMTRWWEKEKRNKPAKVPESAKEAMYSTWYSYHQNLHEDVLLEQCRLSKELGLQSILLDDGWQTDDVNRGYAYCGDWKCAPSKIPDMEAFVKKVHDMGMKVIPWYSLPFIGEKSLNFERFRDMLIDPCAKREWHVLDPRYPEVREFIISLFERALRDWDVDGFKMDFIDEFVVTPFTGNEKDDRRDFESFHEAADYMMKQCVSRLKEKKPDILLEFRQTYNGPLMRSFGNIFRAVDCPFDAAENHVRVTDIRLLSGDSAVHSDMIMWHSKEPAVSAARQIIAVLFSVPQISVRLNELSEEHLNMLKFYCGLWQRYRRAFVDGTFEALNPAGRYSVIKGRADEQFACTWHSREVIQMDCLCEDMLFVNGTAGERLYLEYSGCGRYCRMEVFDCMGTVVREETVQIQTGMNIFAVPQSGAVVLKCV